MILLLSSYAARLKNRQESTSGEKFIKIVKVGLERSKGKRMVPIPQTTQTKVETMKEKKITHLNRTIN
ncbi:CLUMA_CG016104, isoform A [Clunio marinus]|uniref:CLUMA_CG016104, isoform A n=1 Tax=Clunio marinus TaxID=568069 RepID=A0A1J1IT19_9DIPT|nr:CLUMA_CG016104, isoform A [Clunio marinus]